MDLVIVLVADWLQQLRELLPVRQETRWLRLVGAVMDGWLPDIEPWLNEHAALRALADAFRAESARRTSLGTWNYPAGAPLSGMTGLG